MTLHDKPNSHSRIVLSLTLVIITHSVMGFYALKGLLAYVIPSALWTLLFIVILLLTNGLEQLSTWTYRPVVLVALLTAFTQTACLYFIALFTEFGRSPYSFTPLWIAINVAYFTAPILTQEFTRAYVIKSVPRNKRYAGLVLIALLFVLLKLPVSSFFTQRSLADLVKFVTLEVIPAGAQSLLATYLALLGGPLASIAYVWTLEAFNWLMPILPNPPWGLKALISTLVPAMSLVVVNESIPITKMVAEGLAGRELVRYARTKRMRTQKLKEFLSLAAGLVLVIIAWSATGVLGYQVTLVASGSMRPTMDVGDVIVAVQTPAERIMKGDIIQYWRSGFDAPIVHRVMEVKSSGGALIVVTKGDANNAPDEPILVTPKQKLLKVVLTMPKIGWISIALKSAVSSVMAYLLENPLITYVLLIVVVNVLTMYALRHVAGLRKLGGRR